MNPANLKSTSTTPAISLNNGTLSIQGRSIPMSDAAFYEPFIEWGKNLKTGNLDVEIKLEYMNSSSSKKLLLLLKALDSNENLKNLRINWYYEDGDEEAKEQAQVFEKLLKRANFRVLKYPLPR